MSYSVIRHETRPIVIAHVSGELNGDAHFEIAKKACELFEGIVGKIYLVIDLTGVRLEIMDAVDVAAQMTQGWAGTASDPRVITMIAVSGPNSSLIAGHLIHAWEGWRRVFMFPNLAQALACARGPIIYENEEWIAPAS